jgi:hypothetical protein
MNKPNPILKIVWFAIASNTGILLFILNQQAKRGDPAPVPQNVPLQIFYVISVLLFIAAFALPKFLRKVAENQNPQSEFVLNIISWAFLDAIAVLGFISASGTHSLSTYYPFWGLSLLGFILTFPKTAPQNLN